MMHRIGHFGEDRLGNPSTEVLLQGIERLQIHVLHQQHELRIALSLILRR